MTAAHELTPEIRGLADRWLIASTHDGRGILDPYEIDALLGWVHRRMQAYRKGADYLPNPDDYAEWIGLDLGGVFEAARALTRALCEAAAERFGGWPT